jgi:hypothetical protein
MRRKTKRKKAGSGDLIFTRRKNLRKQGRDDSIVVV